MSAASVGPQPRFVGRRVPDTQRLHGLGTEYSGAEQQEHRSRTGRQERSVGRSHERCPQGIVVVSIRSCFYTFR